jgi:hypothetical protein
MPRALIRAGQRAHIALILEADVAAPVAADVKKRAHLAVAPAHHDDGLFADVVEQEIAPVGDFADVIDIKPGPCHDLLKIAPEDAGVAVKRLFQRKTGPLPGQ